MSRNDRQIDIIVERFDPERDEATRSERFTVPFDDDTSLLDGLNYIKERIDGSLTFRWSCRMAICGSCGKMVDGQPRLSCKTFLRDYVPGPVRVEALHHFPIIKDLVVDQSGFLDKLRDGRTWLLREDDRPLVAGLTGRPRSSGRGSNRPAPASTASCATPPARSTALNPISPDRRSLPWSSATTATAATRAGPSACP